MTATDKLPGHVRQALDAVAAALVAAPASGEISVADVVLTLHRAKLLAGDRGCSCNRAEDGQRVVTHQRGDVDFCRDVFEPVVAVGAA